MTHLISLYFIEIFVLKYFFVPSYNAWNTSCHVSHYTCITKSWQIEISNTIIYFEGIDYGQMFVYDSSFFILIIISTN